MNDLALFGTVAVYVVLAILLLSLNIASLWRWWIKAAAIVVTTAVFVAAYFAIDGMIGWPSENSLPARFNLLHTRIVEPDPLRNAPGHVYLWVETVDEHQIVTSPPRAYEVPYTVSTATDVAAAQQKLDGGDKVLGEFAADSDEKPGDRQANASATDSASTQLGTATPKQKSGGPGGAGIETVGDAATLTFSDMPAVDLPDKGATPVVEVGQ